MKKYFVVSIICSLLYGSNTFAIDWNSANCTNRGGVISSGIISGTFCRSTVKMNWWSANVWCQKHGGTLATLAVACPGTPISVGASCTANLYQYSSNLEGSKLRHWLNGPQLNSEVLAWALRPDGYGTTLDLSSMAELGYAFCE